MLLLLLVVMGLLAGVLGEECVVETQKCNFPFTDPGSGQLHFSCQATDNSTASPEFFCRSQIGEEGQERHTYGLCNGGCYDLDGVTPMVFEEDDFMATMCSTAASHCKFPFSWAGDTYHSCTAKGVGEYSWCALEVDQEGVLVADRWGKCNMDTCAEEVKQESLVSPLSGVASYQGSVVGVVSLVQKAPDNPLELRGQLEGLGEGLYRLRLLMGDCQQEEGESELLSEVIGSDGNSSSYISSEEWGLSLYPGSRTQVWGLGLVLETKSGSRICCAAISSSPSVWDSTILTTALVVAGLLLLLLLLAITVYCCCYRRRGKAPISGAGSGFLEDSEEIFLGSRSKTPLYDEISIPFIDASLPPTPKGARSHNALEILLGRRGSSGQLSDADS